ncbi:MAG: DUF3343 domain-containing protein [Oscillibacter sp.]|nr:DUF3343 domain-containing protein [Oscillibacter sp.]
MEQYLVIARSVTHAQRLERLLARAGIRAQIYHAPLELNGGRGCAYAVQFRCRDLRSVLHMIYGADLGPVQVYSCGEGQYREVQV